jgi:hypothetical protein
LRLQKIALDARVKIPSATNASWIPFMNAVGCACVVAGTNIAVVIPAAATPKLIDSCCTVLASELALLDRRCVTSA